MTPDRQSVFRPQAIEAWSNRYLIHPASFWLARRAANTRLTPNHVSLLSIPVGVLAAIAFACYQLAWWWGAAGGILALLRLILDGADGQLARLKQMSSAFGRVLDGVCDYISIGAIYLGFLVIWQGWHALSIFALLLGAYLSRMMQANVYELQRSLYQFWTAGKTAGLPTQIRPHHDQAYTRNTFFNALVRGLDTQYGYSQLHLCGLNTHTLRQALSTQQNRSSATAQAIGKQYDQRFRAWVKVWGLLNDNCHYALLTCCCLLQKPMVYFWLEITLLNALHLLWVLNYRWRFDRFLTQLP